MNKINNDDKLELIQKTVNDCDSLLMDGEFIIPISLKGDQLFIMKKGKRSHVDINDYIFEEDYID